MRTRAEVRERAIELLKARPVERIAIRCTPRADPAALEAEVFAGLPGGVDPAMPRPRW